MNILIINPFSISAFILFSRRLGIFTSAITFLFNKSISIIIWEMCLINNSYIFFPIILDPKGLIFSSVVLFISANVIKFAQTYISSETFKIRFTIVVLLFVLSINILIFFPHLIILLLGWDGLGLTRFILVIYYQNAKSLAGGILTALTNRIGDAALLLAIAWSLNNNNWIIINIWENPLRKFIIISILIAAITKRAQIPFSRWLPAAIAAPTPVSALVHSSTLVTAGIFIIIRFYRLLHRFKIFNTILLLVACSTIFIAGISAITECDLKKIIALSTLRQLGVITARLGLNSPNIAFFHLITHALFKALLFICAGSIIHFHEHGQDLRRVGSLRHQLPFTISATLIANISLCGLPFFSGFYSKDIILELSLFSNTNWIIIFLLILSTALTILYSIRLTINILWSPINKLPVHQINNKDINIILPACLLTIGAISAGTIINWQIIPISQESFLPSLIKTLPLIITMSAAILIIIIWPNLTSLKSNFFKIIINHEASSTMWFLTPISTQFIIKPFLYIRHLLLKTTDQGWLELVSAQGSFNLITYISKNIIRLQKNNRLITINIISLMFIFIFIQIILV